MGGRLLAWGGELEHRFDFAAAGAGGQGCPFMYRGILANQRRGVDVDRRPSRKLSSSNTGAVGTSASEPGLEGTGDEGTGPTWPTGVFACGMMRVTLRWARGECFS